MEGEGGFNIITISYSLDSIRGTSYLHQRRISTRKDVFWLLNQGKPPVPTVSKGGPVLGVSVSRVELWRI